MRTLLLAALLCGQAHAADVALVGLEPGQTYYLKVAVSADGTASVSRMNAVVIGDAPPIVQPDPGGLTGVAKVSFEEAQKIGRPTESTVLAATYSEISRRIRNGDLNVQEAGQFASTAVDTVLGAINAKSRWKPWRQAVANYLRDQQLRTPEQFADAYQALADGLNTSSGGQGEAIDVGVIVKLIAAILSKNPAAIAAAVIELVGSLRR